MTDVSDNPYRPPAAEQPAANLPGRPVSLLQVSNGVRLFHYVFDYVVYLAISVGGGVAFGAVMPGVALAVDSALVQRPILHALVNIVLYTMYFFAFEATIGRTPAKFLTGTMVVSAEGRRPTVAQILGRTLTRFVPFDAFSFLGSGFGWHDGWSGTRVIRTRGVDPAMV